jgi:protein SCO1/2
LLQLQLLAVVASSLWVLQPQSTGHTSSIGGAFSLIDQNGQVFTEDAFKDKVAIVFFGYTHCPDVCPTTLYDLTQVLAKLPQDAPLVVAFVTVDPERDTPASLKDYLTSFDPRINGLSGSRAQIETIAKAYRVYAKKVPGSRAEDYSYDHTALVYVMDRKGDFSQALNLSRPPEATAKEIMSLF